MEARQEQGGGDGSDAPGPGQQEQQGVVEGGEEESRERQHESEERGGEPGVQRQRGKEEGRCRLTNGHGLGRHSSTGKWYGVMRLTVFLLLLFVVFGFFYKFFIIFPGLSSLTRKST